MLLIAYANGRENETPSPGLIIDIMVLVVVVVASLSVSLSMWTNVQQCNMHSIECFVLCFRFASSLYFYFFYFGCSIRWPWILWSMYSDKDARSRDCQWLWHCGRRLLYGVHLHRCFFVVTNSACWKASCSKIRMRIAHGLVRCHRALTARAHPLSS